MSNIEKNLLILIATTLLTKAAFCNPETTLINASLNQSALISADIGGGTASDFQENLSNIPLKWLATKPVLLVLGTFATVKTLKSLYDYLQDTHSCDSLGEKESTEQLLDEEQGPDGQKHKEVNFASHAKSYDGCIRQVRSIGPLGPIGTSRVNPDLPQYIKRGSWDLKVYQLILKNIKPSDMEGLSEIDMWDKVWSTQKFEASTLRAWYNAGLALEGSPYW